MADQEQPPVALVAEELKLFGPPSCTVCNLPERALRARVLLMGGGSVKKTASEIGVPRTNLCRHVDAQHDPILTKHMIAVRAKREAERFPAAVAAGRAAGEAAANLDAAFAAAVRDEDSDAPTPGPEPAAVAPRATYTLEERIRRLAGFSDWMMKRIKVSVGPGVRGELLLTQGAGELLRRVPEIESVIAQYHKIRTDKGSANSNPMTDEEESRLLEKVDRLLAGSGKARGDDAPKAGEESSGKDEAA